MADALSRFPPQLAYLGIAMMMIKEYETLAFLADNAIQRPSQSGSLFLGSLTVTPSLISRIAKAQIADPKIFRILEDLVLDELDDCPTPWRVGTDGALCRGHKLVVPDDETLRKEILWESHRSWFTIHPGGIKMYCDMKWTFWWEGMKDDVADFVSKCMTCQMVKAERKNPPGFLQPLDIPV